MKKISCNEKPKILIELDAFLSGKSNESSLLFLKKDLYLSLYELGIKYLSVPTTSAPMERIFSQSGYIMRLHRASLILKNCVSLLFLNVTNFCCSLIHSYSIIKNRSLKHFGS